NHQLIQAGRLREDVDRISRHDLKNPLNIIIVAPEVILEEGNLSDQQIELLKKITKAGYTMLDMINFSLDLYRMETGAYEFNPDRIDLVKVINRIHDEFEILLKNKNLQWCFQTDEAVAGAEPAYVFAEELLCYSMFANLIKNAIEASLEG